MDQRDLQALSKARLIEAKALLKLGLNDGAYYLAGYAVECAIKACIAKRSQRHEFPDKRRADASYSHNLQDLIKVADLDTHFRRALQDASFWRQLGDRPGMVGTEPLRKARRAIYGGAGRRDW